MCCAVRCFGNLFLHIYIFSARDKKRRIHNSYAVFYVALPSIYIMFFFINNEYSQRIVSNLFFKRILFYLRPERRAVLVLLWLKNIIRLQKSDFKNASPKLLQPALSFIYSNKDSNDIFKLKLKIYKLRMSRG